MSKLKKVFKPSKLIVPRAISNIVCYIIGIANGAIFGVGIIMAYQNIIANIILIAVITVDVIFATNIIVHHFPSFTTAAIDGAVSFLAATFSVVIYSTASLSSPPLKTTPFILIYMLPGTIIAGNIIYTLLYENIAREIILLICLIAYICIAFVLKISLPATLILLGIELGFTRYNLDEP